MAREEADRENLLADATAYRQRIQWRIPAWEEPVFVGFRAEGAASFYFGPDPVYHFNNQGELRRLFLDGLLLKAEQGALVRMRRVRTAREVALRSQTLSHAEQAALCEEVATQLSKLAQALSAGQASRLGQFPEGLDIQSRVLDWLRRNVSIRVAASAGL